MSNSTLEIKAKIQVQKPANEVFDAIADPAKMANYFISEGSARIEEGKTITWKFREFEEKFDIRGGKTEPNKFISFYWEVNKKEMLVEMTLTPAKNGSTTITVTEKGMENTPEGIKWLKGNTEGWANFLACLKAWLEYGINLRKGAFGYLNE